MGMCKICATLGEDICCWGSKLVLDAEERSSETPSTAPLERLVEFEDGGSDPMEKGE